MATKDWQPLVQKVTDKLRSLSMAKRPAMMDALWEVLIEFQKEQKQHEENAE